MRIIFDQATPVPIRPFLEHHAVRTAAQQGWDKLRNGDLLAVADEAGNLAGRKIAIVVLGRQQWPRLRPHVQLVVDAVNAATPGSYVEVEIPQGAYAPMLLFKAGAFVSDVAYGRDCPQRVPDTSRLFSASSPSC